MLIYILLLIAIGLTVSGEVLLKLGMNEVRQAVGAFSPSLPVLVWLPWGSLLRAARPASAPKYVSI